MTAGLLLLAGSAVLLVVGAEVFVDNAAGAARRLSLSVLAVGLLLAGAEPEELLTAVLASARHHPGIAAGDALGATITMLTGTLGLAALVRPLPVGRRVRTYALLSAVAGVLAVAAVAGGRVTRLEGALLLLAYAGLVAFVWWRERTPPAIGELAEIADEEESEATGRAGRGTGVALALVVLGLVLMLAGGDLAVSGATRVVAAAGLTDSAVGLTLVALATTAELFALVFSAARRGVTEIAVAGIVGSAAYNLTATLGAAALVRPLDVGGLLWPAVLAAALPVAVVGLAARGHLTRTGGGILCLGYAAFLWAALR